MFRSPLPGNITSGVRLLHCPWEDPQYRYVPGRVVLVAREFSQSTSPFPSHPPRSLWTRDGVKYVFVFDIQWSLYLYLCLIITEVTYLYLISIYQVFDSNIRVFDSNTHAFDSNTSQCKAKVTSCDSVGSYLGRQHNIGLPTFAITTCKFSVICNVTKLLTKNVWQLIREWVSQNKLTVWNLYFN